MKCKIFRILLNHLSDHFSISMTVPLKLCIKAEAYLEPSRTSTMELFCESSSRLKPFSQKSSILDVRLDCKYGSEK